MKAQKTYRLAKKTVWVARKPGQFTGYGKSPKAAHDAAVGRAKDAVDARLAREELRHRVHQLENRCANLTGKLALLAHKGLTTEEDTADGFVMMAMAYFQTWDAAKALTMATQHGLIVTAIEATAAKRVSGYMSAWVSKLGAGPQGAHS